MTVVVEATAFTQSATVGAAGASVTVTVGPITTNGPCTILVAGSYQTRGTSHTSPAGISAMTAVAGCAFFGGVDTNNHVNTNLSPLVNAAVEFGYITVNRKLTSQSFTFTVTPSFSDQLIDSPAISLVAIDGSLSQDASDFSGGGFSGAGGATATVPTGATGSTGTQRSNNYIVVGQISAADAGGTALIGSPTGWSLIGKSASSSPSTQVYHGYKLFTSKPLAADLSSPTATSGSYHTWTAMATSWAVGDVNGQITTNLSKANINATAVTGPGPFALDSANSGNFTSGTTGGVSVAYTYPNELFVLYVLSGVASPSEVSANVTSVTSTNGLVWALRKKYQSAGTIGGTVYSQNIEEWYAVGSATAMPAGFVVHVTMDQPATAACPTYLMAYSFTGVKDPNKKFAVPAAVTNGAYNATASSPSFATLTTSSAVAFLIGAVADNMLGATAPTAGTGVTEETLDNTGTALEQASFLKSVSSSGVQTFPISGAREGWISMADAINGDPPVGGTIRTALTKPSLSAHAVTYAFGTDIQAVLGENNTSGGSSFTCAVTPSYADGILVMLVQSNNAGQGLGVYRNVTSITDTDGATWQLRGKFQVDNSATASNHTHEIWWRKKADTTAVTVTVNWAGGATANTPTVGVLYSIPHVPMPDNPWEKNSSTIFWPGDNSTFSGSAVSTVGTNTQRTISKTALEIISTIVTPETSLTGTVALAPATGVTQDEDFVAGSGTQSETAAYHVLRTGNRYPGFTDQAQPYATGVKQGAWSNMIDAVSGDGPSITTIMASGIKMSAAGVTGTNVKFGTITTHLTTLSQAAAGAIAASGNRITTSLTKPSMAAAGKTFVPVTGTVAMQLNYAQSAVQGHVGAIGVIATNLTKPSLAASGAIANTSGVIHTTLAGVSQAAVASMREGGTIVTRLPPLGQSAVGKTDVRGSMRMTITGMGFQLHGTAIEVVTGSMTTKFPAMSFGLVARTYEIFTGSITTNLPAPQQSAAGSTYLAAQIVTNLAAGRFALTSQVKAELRILGPIVMHLNGVKVPATGGLMGVAGSGPYSTWRYTDS